MKTPSEATLMLLGLKGTGKTHFLVALDWVLDRQSDPDGLMHSEFAEDRVYVQPLREMWLRGEEFERTSRTVPPPPHQLIAKHPSSGTQIGFHLPDLAGETFDGHFVTRSFPAGIRDRVQSAAGLLLFIHCDSNADHAVLEHPCFIADSHLPDGSVESVHAAEWMLEHAAPQTKLVDLLQFINEVRAVERRLPVAIMLSAWDLVEKAPEALRNEIPNDPAQFLARRWPLLDQYLCTNGDAFEFRVYGVSARGGGNSSGEIERLISFDDPSDRILLVDGNHRSNDLSRPVRWLLGLSDLSLRKNA